MFPGPDINKIIFKTDLNQENFASNYFTEIYIKVACTSGPISSKIMNGYPIFSVEIIDRQVEQMHK